MEFLETLWENIKKKYKGAHAPSLLHKELNVSLRAVRDLLTHEADKLVIDSKDGYDSIMGFLDTFMPGYKNSRGSLRGQRADFRGVQSGRRHQQGAEKKGLAQVRRIHRHREDRGPLWPSTSIPVDMWVNTTSKRRFSKPTF